MQIYCEKDYYTVSRRAANIISAQIIQKQDSVLGLATGSTPIGTYKQLIEWCQKGDLDFSKIKTVNLDEYKGLMPDNPNSYHYFMKDQFFNHINIDMHNTHLPNGIAKDIDSECRDYDALIQSLGGVDLQVLGLGCNGHIGFNEPSNVFEPMTHLVTLTDNTIEANARLFSSKEEVPTQAITMGIKSIMLAKCILLIATGKSKADALYKSLYGPITPAVPASILQLHPNIIVVADEDALPNTKKDS